MLVFLDTETTGFTHNRLIQLALIVGAYPRIDYLVNRYFSPLKEFPIEISAMAKHHITNNTIEGAEIFMGGSDYVVYKNYLEGETVVAHNAKYDVKVMAQEGIEITDYICTMKVAMAMYPELENHSLQYLRYYFDLKVDIPKDLHPHDALYDALCCQALYEYFVDFLELTPNKMIEISKSPVTILKFKFGKHEGKHISEVAISDPKYLEWLYGDLMKKGDEADENMLFTLQSILFGNRLF